MPAVSQMIRSAVRSTGIRQDIIEKDYALSYLMAAIVSANGLNQTLVLKGGTALKKLYFQRYRFSEDLDYSTRPVGPIPQLDEHMQQVVQAMQAALNTRGPFLVDWEPYTENNPHPTGQKAYIVRVQFPEQRQALCRLKVEVTVDEPVLCPVEMRPILHSFPEEFSTLIPAYSLSEIAAEKLRALLQSRERLERRGWGASRVCRDYYDLWNLLQQPGMIAPDLRKLVDQKCAVRNVSYASPRDFVSANLLEIAKSEWPQQLLPFVPDAPPVGEILSQVQAAIFALWM